MGNFILYTEINASVDLCFDLSRSIDLHLTSMEKTDEKAVSGVTEGLIGLNEQVTWQARHFFIPMKLTSKITEFYYPHTFTDEMVEGPFQKMKHKHSFEERSGHTLMTDEFEFSSPFGLLGKLVDFIVLNSYMTALLRKRNEVIKLHAEKDYHKLPEA
ncbi:SRPBCC family protein [Dyadobacter psychrotolerans]|uniref:Cell division protein n=1 Tax=Dyadobacter psychrotolerans TaxID=2541721 RepID=A0A4R5DLD3_9BACT|nr:SRPBCC family protein [Dyadobacter psychrotolerans]TDE12791.1 cell division protein [Dyadobacter psychrotolerans]